MGKQETDNIPALWVEAEVTQADGCYLGNPGPQALHGDTAYPIKKLSGQREYSGGPPVVRNTQDYDQGEETVFAESEEMPGLGKENVSNSRPPAGKLRDANKPPSPGSGALRSP